MSTFNSLAPFIKDYIYREKWDDLRGIQVASCDVIMNTTENLLLASGTSSGKTEAAFLPILTNLYNNPSKSVGVLYISPLKALINDQFLRLDALLEESDIKVTKWHGDASVTAKNKLLKNPQGILQTTPESLEAMLMKRKNQAIGLFCDLRYVIIDEVHSFINEDRGVQLLCLLERLQLLCGVVPIRVGLSATLGQYTIAEKWLSSGTGHSCITPVVPGEKRNIKISLAHFFVSSNGKTPQESVLNENYYNYLYAATFGKKSIIFANSKAEVESNIANLKNIARRNHTPDNYMVHHGNISASLREFTEDKMKSESGKIVTGATVTLELGIDLGSLERVVQTGCPVSVSSFVQRLGRSGRRDGASEMWFVFKEEKNIKECEFYRAICWPFLKCLATIEVYLQEKWVEPLTPIQLPFSVLYHQTMSFLASSGEVTPAFLAQKILTLTPFSAITKGDYKILLQSMMRKGCIESTENGGIILGINGEYETNNFEFYSVFETLHEYSVKNGSEEIGSVQNPFPIGERFALAGRSWEVLDVDKKTAIIYVKEILGISANQWDGASGAAVHTKVMKKIKSILTSDNSYGYLSQDAKIRLTDIRTLARNSGILTKMIVPISGNVLAIFPFIGTRELHTLSYILSDSGIKNEIFTTDNVPVCIFVQDCEITPLCDLLKSIKSGKITLDNISLPNCVKNGGKYDDFIPPELQKKQFKQDFLSLNGLISGLEI